jgi:hypothetical protein
MWKTFVPSYFKIPRCKTRLQIGQECRRDAQTEDAILICALREHKKLKFYFTDQEQALAFFYFAVYINIETFTGKFTNCRPINFKENKNY